MIADVINMMPVLLFLDISFGEIFIVVVVIFVVFGPQRIPEFARKFGKGMREIKKASSEIKREINKEVNQYKTDLDLERIVKDADPLSEKKSTEEGKSDNKEAGKDVKV